MIILKLWKGRRNPMVRKFGTEIKKSTEGDVDRFSFQKTKFIFTPNKFQME